MRRLADGTLHAADALGPLPRGIDAPANGMHTITDAMPCSCGGLSRSASAMSARVDAHTAPPISIRLGQRNRLAVTIPNGYQVYHCMPMTTIFTCQADDMI